MVDDGSPDGTGELAEKLAAARRAGARAAPHAPRPGSGPAYVAGFRWAREHGYDVVVEMDADGSHAPEQLPRLLAALDDADLVLGSRYVPGGAVTDWPAHRLLLSRLGNRYTRWALRLPLHDATGGYRAARGRADRPAALRRRRQPGLLLPGRLGLAGGPRRCPGDRGADHFHRTAVRPEQDERLDR